MPGERYPVVWIGPVAVLALPAEVDVSNADAVRECLLSLINRGASLLVADMSATTFCDSAGVSALVRAYRRAAAGAGGLRLVVTTPAVRRVLSLTGVDRMIPVFASTAAALAGARPQQGPGGGPAQGNTIAAADSDGEAG